MTDKRDFFALRMAIFFAALIVNIIFYIMGLKFTWTVFLSGILLFMWTGDIKDRFISIELGGFVGLLFCMGFLWGLTVLTPIVGKMWGFTIPLAIVLFTIIVLQPSAPLFFNNASFAYFSCACISAEEFAQNFSTAILTFLVGSPLYCGFFCILLHNAMKERRGKSSEST